MGWSATAQRAHLGLPPGMSTSRKSREIRVLAPIGSIGTSARSDLE